MMFSTNYNKKDWTRLFYCGIVCFFIVGLPVLLYFDFFFMPIMEVWNIWLDLVVDDTESSSIVGQFVNATIDDYPFDQKSDYEILKYFFASFNFAFILVIGAPIIVLLVLVWILDYLLIPSSKWICNKLKITPQMKLVIFRNGKPMFQKKVGKKKW